MKFLVFIPFVLTRIKRAGITPTRTITSSTYRNSSKLSFSHPPVASDLPPALSAPVGYRGILAEVRAPMPPRPTRSNLASAKLNHLHTTNEMVESSDAPRSKPITIAQQKGGTMSRGFAGGKSAQITNFAWLSSVKVGGRRESSSGPGSGAESGNVSRLSSTSRPPPSALEASSQHVNQRPPKDRVDDEFRDGDATRYLHDE